MTRRRPVSEARLADGPIAIGVAGQGGEAGPTAHRSPNKAGSGSASLNRVFPSIGRIITACLLGENI